MNTRRVMRFGLASLVASVGLALVGFHQITDSGAQFLVVWGAGIVFGMFLREVLG